MDKTKMALITQYERGLIFNTLGFKVIVDWDLDKIDEEIYNLVSDNYLIIFLDDELFLKTQTIRNKYQHDVYPLFTPIPLKEGKSLGLEQIYENIEKAIGFNIFRKEENDG